MSQGAVIGGAAGGLVRSPANAIQHGGKHYKGMRIEPWDYIVANEIGFLEGNAIKYLTRWREKGGVEDLKKAGHYVQKVIEVETAKAGQNVAERQSREA